MNIYTVHSWIVALFCFGIVILLRKRGCKDTALFVWIGSLTTFSVMYSTELTVHKWYEAGIPLIPQLENSVTNLRYFTLFVSNVCILLTSIFILARLDKHDNLSETEKDWLRALIVGLCVLPSVYMIVISYPTYFASLRYAYRQMRGLPVSAYSEVSPAQSQRSTPLRLSSQSTA